MIKKILLLIVLAAFIFWIIKTFYNVELQSMMETNAVERQVDHICEVLAKGGVNQEQLCNEPVYQLPVFELFYASIKRQDEEWYRERGSLYYPVVSCKDGQVYLFLLENLYRCEKGKALQDKIE